MKIIDNRFNEDLIKSFVGKKLARIKHDHFRYTNTVTGIVGFMIEDKSYAMVNDFEEVDYLDWDNEACVCRITERPWNEIRSFVEGEEQITTEINEIVEQVTIINDHIESYSYGEKDYDVWETRAIIFDLGSYQVSFTKQVCFFSMEIEVNRGYDLINKIETTDAVYTGHNVADELALKIGREIVTLSD